jgi:hypothetical protein
MDVPGYGRVVTRETHFIASWTDMTAFEEAVRRAAACLVSPATDDAALPEEV